MKIKRGLLEICYLFKTGQETSYYAGDDGDLELGIDHDYEIKTTGDQSGTTAIVINGKTHNLSNNIVADHTVRVNGKALEWARYVPNADIGPAADGRLFWKQWTLANKTDISFDSGTKVINSVAGEFSTDALCVGRKVAITGAGEAGNNQTVTVTAITANNMTVSEAIVDEAVGASISFATVDDLIWDFLDQANANNLGGYNDWRIPNRYELDTITNIKYSNPCTDSTVFPSIPSDYIYTASTKPPGNENKAFGISFSSGTTYSGHVKTTVKGYVLLVRS